MKEFIYKYGFNSLMTLAAIFCSFHLGHQFERIDDKFYKQQHDIDMIRTVLIVKDIMPIEVHSLMRNDWKEDE